MSPTFLPKGKLSITETKPVAQMWHQSGSCPEGTVPIRRTTKEDIMRASSFQRFAMKDIKSIPTNLSQSLYTTTSNHEVLNYNNIIGHVTKVTCIYCLMFHYTHQILILETSKLFHNKLSFSKELIFFTWFPYLSMKFAK